MRTTVTLDDELLKDAEEYTGISDEPLCCAKLSRLSLSVRPRCGWPVWVERNRA